MEKLYTIRFNKKNVDKNNVANLYAFKVMRSRLRVFNSENLYVQLFSGNVACQDAFHYDSSKHIPLIIGESASGNLYDRVMGHDITLVGPLEKGQQVSKEMYEDYLKSLVKDDMSFESYRQSVDELLSIITEYNDALENVPESFMRRRQKKN